MRQSPVVPPPSLARPFSHASPIARHSQGFLPARVLEVELTEPLPGLSQDSNSQRVWVLGRLHTEPIGSCVVWLEESGLSPDQLGALLWQEFWEPITQRFVSAGLPEPGVLTGAGLTADRSVWPFLRYRSQVLADAPFISVVICTRDRPEQLASCLDHLGRQDYPDYEVVVVDNAPTGDGVRAVVEARQSRPKYRYVAEPRAGLSWARNAGVATASGEVIAFLDDDDEPDPHWLAGLACGFARSPDTGCITGPVVPAELAAPAQELFEQLGGHPGGRGFRAVAFSANGPQNPLYPLPPFGSGANMAFRRDVLARIGGFDVALGAGTLAFAGEDMLAFTLTLLAGYRIRYEPAALMRHYHRRDLDSLRRQLNGYSVGVTAYYAALVRRQPKVILDLIRLTPTAARYLRGAMAPRPTLLASASPDLLEELNRHRRLRMLIGPVAYARSARLQRKVAASSPDVIDAGQPMAQHIGDCQIGAVELRGKAGGRSESLWQRNWDLVGNAGSLAATTGATSALGFVFWALAARLFSQQAVGYGSAAVSAMTLLGTIGMLGLGTVLIAELPRRSPRSGLILAALLASGTGSFVLGLTFALTAPAISDRFRDLSRTPGQVSLFAAGVSLTGLTLVFDQATIGLLRGGLQLARNIAFAVIKLMILPAAAIILHEGPAGITLSWVVSMALSLVPVALKLRFSGTAVFCRPDWKVLRGLGKTAAAHNWLNLALAIPRSLIPVLVIVVVSPAANAAFYVAWTLSGFLYIVPMHLAMALFAVAAADPRVIPSRLRFTLRLSVLIGLPGMVALGLGARFALGLFGTNYAREGTIPLLLLVIGYLPMIPKLHFVAVCRAANRIPRAAKVMMAAAGAEVAAAVAGGALYGLNGLTLALLAVFLLEGLATAPSVSRAAFRPDGQRLLARWTEG